MQVNETLSEGLKREYQIIVPASDVEAEVQGRLLELSKTVKMKGFRPGKVPLAIVSRQYRPSVMGEVLERTIQTTSQKAIEERELRPALQPKIEITEFNDGKDLEFKMDLEILPDIEIGNLSEVSLTRPTAEVDDEKVDDGLKRIADADKQFTKTDEDRAAESGDALVIDFKGAIEGVVLDGTSADDFEIELGSGSFIPGFEEQLIGAKVGQHLDVNVTFPDNYPQEDAAGKPAVFAVDIKELRTRDDVAIDDAMASRQGFDNLAALKDMVRERLQEQFAEASKGRLKRSLLDLLSESYEFDVPTGMVEQEYETIWTQVKKDLEQAKATVEDALGQTEEEAETEYRDIAERRVRLGLLLSEVGRQKDITIERDDLLNAALESARGFSNPQQVLEFYRSNPNALERFRAPVFEDKVVAFLTELATVTDEVVDAEELFRDPDEEEAIAKEDKAKEKKAAKKKTAAKPAAKKKAASKKSDDDSTSDDDESGDEKKAAKKKPAAKAKAKAKAKSAKSADKPAKSAAKTAKDD